MGQETKQGIFSHHIRLYILALAADHWVQGRIAAIRKSTASIAGNNAVDALALNMKSGREVLLALAPKCLLAKIIKAHVPPVDSDGKPKRDTIKKLALESARVSVACIQAIALMACDWRRRFGSSQESKYIVSVAVGLLMSKIDDTPIDDAMKAVMGPTCDAAVVGIQSFHESSGMGALDQSFLLLEQVTQPVKIKIKPLVASSKPNPRPRDDVMREVLMQLSRQIVAFRGPAFGASVSAGGFLIVSGVSGATCRLVKTDSSCRGSQSPRMVVSTAVLVKPCQLGGTVRRLPPLPRMLCS